MEIVLFLQFYELILADKILCFVVKYLDNISAWLQVADATLPVSLRGSRFFYCNTRAAHKSDLVGAGGTILRSNSKINGADGRIRINTQVTPYNAVTQV